ncbi:hypothetical protein Y032_0021g286 [Ancylostoma ceylanicum]|uniref:G-protein coupled receptors family 1 profile domain-containing protein n=1 Tax=Ancylostoma ceylanicum TaxID=53326 RepID=A0A016UYW3_9BILA|nr:hypothetical protein Y032_0021g286 [Ancylostoma ceylanicum]
MFTTYRNTLLNFNQTLFQAAIFMVGNSTDNDYEALEEIFAFNAQSDHEDYNEYKLLAAIIYSALALGGLAVNILFCCVIWRTDKLHTVTHMLMTNLAVSNIFFLMFHPPYFLTTFILESNWKFGTLMCKASFSVGYVTVTGSFYFMCLVAIDRWLAIFYRKKRLDRKRCICLTTGAWVLSVIVASPYIYKSQVLDMNILLDDDPLKTVKTEVTRCGAESMPWDDVALILTILVQYVVPLVIMIPAYSHLSYFLWQRPTVGVQSKERARKANAKRRRLTITLIAIVAILISCWSPLFSVGILHRFHPEVSFPLYIITSMIALLGVLCTPLCYMANDGFRQQMVQLFPCLAEKERTSDRSTQRFLEVEATTHRKGMATVATCTSTSSVVLHKKNNGALAARDSRDVDATEQDQL